MIEKLVSTRVISSSTESSPIEAPAARRGVEFSLSFYAMQIILAYEWLLSGIDKVVNPHFGAQLPTTLRGSTLVNPYGWYNTFVEQLVLPHAALLAPMVELGELGIGVVLIVSAVCWMWRPLARPTRYLGWAACLALAGSLLLSLNYSFQQGTPLPWVNGVQAFGPGVGVDMLVAFLSLPLLAANLRTVRVTSIQLRGIRGSRWMRS